MPRAAAKARSILAASAAVAVRAVARALHARAMPRAVLRATLRLARFARPPCTALARLGRQRRRLTCRVVQTLAAARAEHAASGVAAARLLRAVDSAPPAQALAKPTRRTDALAGAPIRAEAVAAVGSAESQRAVATLLDAAGAVEAAVVCARRLVAARARPPLLAVAHTLDRVARPVTRAQLPVRARTCHLPTIGSAPPRGAHTRAVEAGAARGDSDIGQSARARLRHAVEAHPPSAVHGAASL